MTDIESIITISKFPISQSEAVCTVPIIWDIKLFIWYGWDTVYYDDLAEFGYLKYLVTSFRLFPIIIQQIVTLSKYSHDALDICYP